MEGRGAGAVVPSEYGVLSSDLDATMELVVQLSFDAAKAVLSGSNGSESLDELRRTLESLDASIRPQFISESDPTSARYFVVEVPDDRAVDESLRALRRLSCVEGAYPSPHVEPPE